MRHGLLHHARRLDDLRQEHLARAEQVADDIHAVHQRPFDHVDRPAAGRVNPRPDFFGVFHDEVRDAMNQRVSQALIDRLVAPFEVLFFLRGAGFEFIGDFEETIRAVIATIQHHVFDAFAQFRIEILVHAELPRVHDPHVHARLNRVIEEHGMDGLAHRIVAAKRERHVRHAAADLRVRQVFLDPARGVDEVDRVVVVLFDARRDSEDVRIEDDVFRREADFVHEEVVRALADLRLAFEGVGLAVFVEGHHDGCGAVAADQRSRGGGTRLRLPSSRSS